MPTLDYQPGQLLPGTVYRVLRLIGVGGMGTVYDVEDTSIGKRYVVKTLHPKLGARDDLARRVLKEARTLARLNHPNIIEVITAGVTGDEAKLPYYVMERLNGQSLRMVIDKKGRLELSHAYHIGIDLLDALDHAHDKGLIHRDVKPDNIFLHRTAGGVTVTKLLDFGIVSVLDSAVGSSETAGRFLGTLRYAAPEQLKGETPTAKMDVYAAALVLYEIIAGRGPFDDQGDAAAVGAAHVNKLAPRLSSHVPVPRELDNLIVAALAKDPRMRPRDAFSFAASLRNMSRSLRTPAPSEVADGRTTVAGVMALVADSSPTGIPAGLSATPAAAGAPAPSAAPPISPASPASPARVSARPPAPNATLIGMPPLTVGPAAPVTTTLPDVQDRAAATRSIDTELAHLAVNGTEGLSAAPGVPLSLEPKAPADAGATVPCEPPSDMGLDPIDWPAVRPAVHSDDPQVRSITATGRRAAPRGPWLVACAGVAILVALGIAALLRRPASGEGPAEMATAAGRPPHPIEPEIVPAPTLEPPAFEPGEVADSKHRPDPVPAPSAGAAAAAASASSGSPARFPSSRLASGDARKAPARPALERPGPGF